MRTMFLWSMTIVGISSTALAASVGVSNHIVELKRGVSRELKDKVKADPTLAIAILNRCAAESEARTKRHCLLLTKELNNTELAEPVKIFLKDDNANVRREAAQVLREILPKQAAPLIAALADDPDPFTRASIITSLKDLQGRDAHPLLRRKMEDPDSYVKLVAAILLAQDGVPVSRGLAIRHLDSTAERTRGRAIELLGYVGKESDFARLEEIAAKRGYNKGDALKALQQLRMTLASDAVTRRKILDDSLRDSVLERWAAQELVRRYRLGELEMKDIATKVAEDERHPARFEARSALELMNVH